MLPKPDNLKSYRQVLQRASGAGGVRCKVEHLTGSCLNFLFPDDSLGILSLLSTTEHHETWLKGKIKFTGGTEFDLRGAYALLSDGEQVDTAVLCARCPR